MLLTIYLGFVGLVIGSAINAIVWRLYVGRKWSKGRSMCPECKHVLAPKDLIPIVSWLTLGGKCRYCRAPIKDSPIVEAITAVLFALSMYVLAPVTPIGYIVLGLWLLLLTLLIILAVYDKRWMLLPDKIMLPAIGVAGVLVLVRALSVHSWLAARGPLLAALLFGGMFFAIVAISKGRAMGGGDIKFVFLMGLVLGLRGTLLGLLIAFDVAAVVAVALIVLKRRGRRDQIAFGPFLAGATVATYLYGAHVIHWYLTYNGLAN
ncbi:prepilin peptidase [Candidatus Saccharibacteria bacterium]|nr:prepilin peptidase [Candidatus Saccharibacteria bacterium]